VTLLDAGDWAGRIYTDGWNTAAGGSRTVTEPATGDELGSVGLADQEDLDRAATRATDAQPGWAATNFEERAAVLRRAGVLWEEHAKEIEDWLVREAGSIPPKAQVETHVAAQECYEAAALASHTLGRILPTARPRLSLARRLPVGVVGVIAPFNYPLILSIRSVAPALALGNAVVLKPDPRTAVSGGVTLARIFEEAGLPPGLLHVLPGGPDVGAALVEHPQVPVISFTGSSAAGRQVGSSCGRLLKRSLLELGGNSALVVLDDADLDLAVSAGAFGSRTHTSNGSPPRPTRSRSATRRRNRLPWARSSMPASGTRCTDWSRPAWTRVPGSPRAARTRNCSTDRRCWRATVRRTRTRSSGRSRR
jgi:benzaldehyde dehydrogenase (NAD)